MEAEIVLRYNTPLFAKSMKSALLPDNRLPSEGMRISTRVHGRTLRVVVEDCKGIETLKATVQDIFRCVRAAESSLRKVEAR